jgi:hypothetical protein
MAISDISREPNAIFANFLETAFFILLSSWACVFPKLWEFLTVYLIILFSTNTL